MPGEEQLRLLLAHVTREDFRSGAGEIDHHKTVEGVAEPRIDTEGEELAAELDVLANEDGQAFAVGFEIGDWGGEIFDIGEQRAESGGFPLLHEIAAEGPARLHGATPFHAGVLALEVARDQLARGGRIPIADADGANEFRILGVTADECADAFPEQKQGSELTLVIGGNEGTAHLDGGAECGEEAGAEAEERIGVKTLLTEAGEEFRDIAETIGAGDFGFVAIPEEEVEIVGVEAVEIAGLAGAFAGSAEGDLALAADFLERERNLAGLGEVDGEFAGVLHQATRGQGVDFSGEKIGRNWFGNGSDAGGCVADGFGAAGQEFGAEAQVAGGFDIVGQSFDAGRLNDAADADFDGLAVFVEQLGGKSGGAQAGMHHAEHLEGNAVVAANQDGQRFRLCDTDEAGGGDVPCGIADGALFQIEMRNFAGGKEEQQAARAQVLDGLTEGASVRGAAFGTVEGIDKEAEGRELGEIAEKLVGEDANVGASAHEEIGEHDAVEDAEGVVGNGDDGAGGRDLFEIGGRDVYLDLKIVEEGSGEAMPGAGTRVEFFKPVDFQEIVDRMGQRDWQTVGRKSFECHSSG